MQNMPLSHINAQVKEWKKYLYFISIQNNMKFYLYSSFSSAAATAFHNTY